MASLASRISTPSKQSSYVVPVSAFKPLTRILTRFSTRSPTRITTRSPTRSPTRTRTRVQTRGIITSVLSMETLKSWSRYMPACEILTRTLIENLDCLEPILSSNVDVYHGKVDVHALKCTWWPLRPNLISTYFASTNPPTESNITESFVGLPSYIYKCLVHSKFVIWICFVPHGELSWKNKTIVYSKRPLRNTAGLYDHQRSCVSILIRKYIASPPRCRT